MELTVVMFVKMECLDMDALLPEIGHVLLREVHLELMSQ